MSVDAVDPHLSARGTDARPRAQGSSSVGDLPSRLRVGADQVEQAHGVFDYLADYRAAEDLVTMAREAADTLERLEQMTKAETPMLVYGYDAAFWHESYTMLRDAVTTHLDGCIRDDDVAEEAILVEAIETAGERLAASEAKAERLEKELARAEEQCGEHQRGENDALNELESLQKTQREVAQEMRQVVERKAKIGFAHEYLIWQWAAKLSPPSSPQTAEQEE